MKKQIPSIQIPSICICCLSALSEKRTSIHLLSFALICGAVGSAQDAAPVAVAKQPVGEAWLRLSVSKPDDVTTTQLPALPPGIGFVVKEIAAGGPA
jgi:hypothetical protein